MINFAKISQFDFFFPLIQLWHSKSWNEEDLLQEDFLKLDIKDSENNVHKLSIIKLKKLRAEDAIWSSGNFFNNSIEVIEEFLEISLLNHRLGRGWSLLGLVITHTQHGHEIFELFLRSDRNNKKLLANLIKETIFVFSSVAHSYLLEVW